MTPILRTLLLFAPIPVWAQPIDLHIDPAQTKVEYTVASTLHTVHGVFQLKRGEISFDPATGRASGELVVDARTGESGSAGRDRRMHESILESARYPDIVFRPDHVEGSVQPTGHSDVTLHGSFLIHGASHEITVPLSVDASPGSYKTVAKFVIPYIQWGMKNPSTFVLRVSDKVEITILTVAH
jgi:polyisoprenoid-binding protein YceI